MTMLTVSATTKALMVEVAGGEMPGAIFLGGDLYAVPVLPETFARLQHYKFACESDDDAMMRVLAVELGRVH